MTNKQKAITQDPILTLKCKESGYHLGTYSNTHIFVRGDNYITGGENIVVLIELKSMIPSLEARYDVGKTQWGKGGFIHIDLEKSSKLMEFTKDTVIPGVKNILKREFREKW